MNPEFFVIAGPNGAGKTTFGRELVPTGVPIFNGDLVFAELIKQYPHIDPERLKGGVPVALERARDAATTLKRGFAFETNFSSDLTTELINLFKAHGYKVNLIYIGLNDLLSAKARVAHRVVQGGHDIPSDVIKYNLEEGVNRVVNSIHLFDKIEFIDNKLKPEAIAIATAPPFAYQILSNNVTWFNEHFKGPMEKFMLNQVNTESKKPFIERKPRKFRKGRKI